MMYVQVNENGYVAGVTEEEGLVGLFGGSGRSKRVSDEEGADIEQLLSAKRSIGEGVHIDNLVDSIKRFRAAKAAKTN